MTIERLQRNLQQTLERGKLKVSRPAGCSSIALYLYDPEAMHGPLSHDEAQAVVAEPAYWSFCWASGQVLAQYILDHPEWVRGKHVWDVGCGSGIVAIAAAMAGAKGVTACDIDPMARDAAFINAQLNEVNVTVSAQLPAPGEADLITAADVLYDPDNLPLLQQFQQLSKQVLLADSRIKVLPVDFLKQLTVREARTWPDLNEFEEFNQVRLYAS